MQQQKAIQHLRWGRHLPLHPLQNHTSGQQLVPPCSMEEEKSISNSSLISATSQTEDEPTSAGAVTWTTLLDSGVLHLKSPLYLHNIKHYLVGYPDHRGCDMLLDSIHNGVNIGFTGDWKCTVSDNWNSALMHS